MRRRIRALSACLGFLVFMAGSSAFASGPQAAISDEAPFMAENDAAMNKMMADMSVKPTGNVDQDFVDVMVPHHQGAIDMAQAELRYGHNEQLRRIAQEIVVEQQQEIVAMRLALGQPLPHSVPAPDQQRPNDIGRAAPAPMSHRDRRTTVPTLPTMPHALNQKQEDQ